MKKIEVIFAEFGVVDLEIQHFRNYFPDAFFTLFTDIPQIPPGFDAVHRVSRPFQIDDPRYGHHMNDYWQIKGMLESDAEICVSFDGDMRIVAPEVNTIIPLTEKFGLCLPANPRMLAKIDATIGIDGGSVDFVGGGNGFAFNAAIAALDKRHAKAVSTARMFCRIMEQRPVRGPLAWWHACWETGFFPCLLPFQWCVCAEHVGIGNEIVLHVGHDAVRCHYGVHRP